jgi:hypothetical protein
MTMLFNDSNIDGDGFEGDNFMEISKPKGFAGNVFTNLPSPQPQTKTGGPKKPSNPLAEIQDQFNNARVWTVQNWTRNHPDEQFLLDASDIHNGLTLSEAFSLKAEIERNGDRSINSVEIILRLGY